MGPGKTCIGPAVTVLLVGGVSAEKNVRLDHYDARAGYRYAALEGGDNRNERFIVLAFSGGGTRAAALSFGLLEALREIDYHRDGAPRALLDDVDVISSVSGGSFTAAYYALFGEGLFEDFEAGFLKRNLQGDLLRRTAFPSNWFRLASPTFDRIDLAAEYHDRTVFAGKRFKDLLEQVAARLLLASEGFRDMMQSLDSGWRYNGGDLDPKLVTAVCGDARA